MSFIEKHLGESAARGLTYLIMGTVVLGMPASAMIVGHYFGLAFHIPSLIYIVALIIIVLGAITNLIHITVSRKILLLISFLLIVTCFCVYVFTVQTAAPKYPMLLHFRFSKAVVMGILLAFWAFAGFENMTFLARKFSNPIKDFKKCLLISLFLCGVIYVLLSINYAVLIPDHKKHIAGLLQLAYESRSFLLAMLVVVLGFLSVQLNFMSWLNGVASLMQTAANKRWLPYVFNLENKHSMPFLSILCLSFAFLVTIALLSLFPRFLEMIITQVSENFVIIYVLSLLAYIKGEARNFLFLVAVGLLFAFIFIAFASPVYIIYPFLILFVGYLVCRLLPSMS